MSVISLAQKEKLSDKGHDYWLRRQALRIVNELPEDAADALQILEYAKKFHAELLVPG